MNLIFTDKIKQLSLVLRLVLNLGMDIEHVMFLYEFNNVNVLLY